MPATTVMYFMEPDGSRPVFDWLLAIQDVVAIANLVERIESLEREGYRLPEPAAKQLGNGMRELRAKRGRVQYRILCCFVYNVAVLLHGCTKERVIEPADMKRAVDRKIQVEQNFKSCVWPRNKDELK